MSIRPHALLAIGALLVGCAGASRSYDSTRQMADALQESTELCQEFTQDDTGQAGYCQNEDGSSVSFRIFATADPSAYVDEQCAKSNESEGLIRGDNWLAVLRFYGPSRDTMEAATDEAAEAMGGERCGPSVT